jgi:hypothetical protein
VARLLGRWWCAVSLEDVRLAYDLVRYGATYADAGTLLDSTKDAARVRLKYHALRHGWPWPPVRVEGRTVDPDDGDGDAPIRGVP